jgi:hypothetical protein
MIDGTWGGFTIKGPVVISNGRPDAKIQVLGNNKYIFDFPDDKPYVATAASDGNTLYFTPSSAVDLGTQSPIIWIRACGELYLLIARLSLWRC